jgi:hypothetical protein
MTTDMDKLTFFSVDVETSALRPDQGELLTIGAVAVSGTGHIIDTFYVRINRRNLLHESWFNEALPVTSPTQEFWRKQEQYVKDEAYMSHDVERVTPITAATRFRNWVLKFGDTWEDRVFVANPVAFDKMWVLNLFMEVGLEDPFHYRSVCLRSVDFGRVGGDWRDSIGGRSNAPRYPHHALSDAYAQAQDLLELLDLESPIYLDEPYYENAPVEEPDDEEIEDSLLVLLEGEDVEEEVG